FDRYQTVAALEKDLETALDPDRVNEEPFIPSTDTEENTKAIPILSNNEYNETIRSDDETKIVNESTQPNNLKNEMEEKQKEKKKKPKKKKSKKKKIVIWLASRA